jgi:hypothetical protein
MRARRFLLIGEAATLWARNRATHSVEWADRAKRARNPRERQMLKNESELFVK